MDDFLRNRQIHLDFSHERAALPTSASEFDAGAWAQMLADAHVDSVNLPGVLGHHGTGHDLL